MRTRVVCLLLVLVALSLLLTRRTTGGPLEARRLQEEARALRHATWRRQAMAWRAVLAEAVPSDRVHRRALESWAKDLRRAGLPHGAAALESRAATLGPTRDRGRIGSQLGLIRGLRKEGDLDAATPLLAEVADLARNVAPTMADRARAWQVDDAVDRGDLQVLEHLATRLDDERAGIALRLEAVGALGLLRLRDDDLRGARRALVDAERLYRTSQKEGDKLALRCAKLWLDLELRTRLPKALAAASR